MSKLIAVCGSPESGKTTLGLKLAQEIYFTKKTSLVRLLTTGAIRKVIATASTIQIIPIIVLFFISILL